MLSLLIEGNGRADGPFPPSPHLFFYTSCKTVRHSSEVRLLKVCEEFSPRASIQPTMRPARHEGRSLRLVPDRLEMLVDCLTAEREGRPVPFVVKLQVASGMSGAYGVIGAG